ncbi:unnamed protein product, partial [Oppiella nova]
GLPKGLVVSRVGNWCLFAVIGGTGAGGSGGAFRYEESLIRCWCRCCTAEGVSAPMTAMQVAVRKLRRKFLKTHSTVSQIYNNENLIYVKFFKFYRCYDLIPVSAKLVVFDTQLVVKKAFFALLSNGSYPGMGGIGCNILYFK